MAGVCSKSDVKDIDHLLTCCLGDHPLDDPRLLPCQHSFCTDCVKNKLGKERKDFVCPKCQLSIPLTEKDVDQLPKDILYQIVQDTRHDDNCVTCQFDDKKTPGKFQCLDCADVLCGECKVGHTKSSQTRFHRVVLINDIKAGKYKSDMKSEKPLVCQVHDQPNAPMMLQYYCEECKCLVCSMCLNTFHKGHDFKSIDEIHDKKKTVVTNHITELIALKDIVLKFAAVLKQELGQNKERKEQLEYKAQDIATQLIDIIEKAKEDILKHIKGHFDTENTSIQRKLFETESTINCIDSIVNYTQALLEHSGKAQFLQHENEMMKKLTERKQHKMDTTLKTTIFKLGQPQFAETEAFITDAFGKTKTKTKTLGIVDETDVRRVLMKEPKMLFHEHFGSDITGDVTVTKNEDIVAVRGNAIQVYNSDGKHKETILCIQLQNPWNVVAKDDTIYVSENVSGNVHVMNLKGYVNKTLTLPYTNQGYGNTGLAVDDEGNVYISSSATHTIYKSETNETNGQAFIQQDTYPDLKGPSYLCVTPNGSIVVSNCGSHSIHMYNRQGKFLWQYKGRGNMALSDPQGICCDNDGYIYVADYLNNRIQIIKDAVSIGCLMNKDFNNPWSVAIDTDGNIVSGNRGGIFKVKCWK